MYSTDGPTGNANGNLQLTMDRDTGGINVWTNSGDLDVVSATSIADGRWHHVAVRRASGVISIWVDGTEDALDPNHATTTYNGAIGGANSGTPRPCFGVYTPASGLGSYRGELDAFTLYKLALSDTQLADITGA